MNDLSNVIQLIKEAPKQVLKQLGPRSIQASHELRNAELEVMRGSRGGRSYHKPGTGRVKYNKRNKTAKVVYRDYASSAPGEPPAVRTGVLRGSFRPLSQALGSGFLAALETNNHYAGYLEDGTCKMAARPYGDRIIEMAEPKINEIFTQPFDIG